MVQDELTKREQAIHHNKLIYAAGRLVAVTVYCLRDSLNLLVEEVMWHSLLFYCRLSRIALTLK